MNTNPNDIIKEKSNRLFFLKAILLGIQYAESGKSENIKKIINEEIQLLEPSQNNSINSINKNSVESLNDSNEFKMKTMQTLQKYEQILHNLDSQRVSINSQIANLSSHSYLKTLSLNQSQQIQKQIFELKKTILYINKEIEKYSLLHQSVFKMSQQPKISPQENIMKKNKVNNFIDPHKEIYKESKSIKEPFFFNKNDNKNDKITSQNKSVSTESFSALATKRISKPDSVSFFPSENNNETSPSSDFSDKNYTSKNNNYESEESSDDLLKELQKTFGNLSSLLTP